MATEQALTLYEDNDETLTLTILPAAGETLAGVDAVEMVLKADACDADDADDAVLYTTDSGGGIVFNTHTDDEIVATVTIPAADLADPYDRFFRVDAMTGDLRRTAMYGPVTVIDL